MSSSVGDLTVFENGLPHFDKQVIISFDDAISTLPRKALAYYVHMQLEPPEVLDCIDTIIANANRWDLILAWHERVLAECPNAVLFPQALCVWIDKCYLPFCKEE